MVGSMTVPGVRTGVGFSKLKNCWTRLWIWIQKFLNRSGVGVWKSDSGHLLSRLQISVSHFKISVSRAIYHPQLPRFPV